MTTVFILRLVKCVKLSSKKFHFTSCGLFDLDGYCYNDGKALDAIDCTYDAYIRRNNNSYLTKSEKSRFDELINRVNRLFGVIHAVARAKWKMNEYDIIHLQGMFSPRYEEVLTRAFNKTPLLVSLWGGEVMMTCDIKSIKIHQKILNRADAMTVTGPEFKEIVLSKYGRHLDYKICETFFDPEVDPFCDGDRASSNRNFRKTHNIDENRTIVCVGHNGKEECQHIDVLESLGQMDPVLKRSIIVVLPMTYGANSERDPRNQARS